jgi:micrococcal nuclease
VIDGDTIVLADGTHVRLVQIDTPEVGTGECFSRAAGRELRALLPPGGVGALEADPRLDQVDRYGRLLRYVVRNGRNLNVELVRRGAATVWFYDGDRGRYAVRLLAAATAARSAHRGLWGACPKAVWNPYAAARTGPGSPAAASTAARRPVAGGSCDPSYPTVCIPSPPPDLDCGDVPYRLPCSRPTRTGSTATTTDAAARLRRRARRSTTSRHLRDPRHGAHRLPDAESERDHAAVPAGRQLEPVVEVDRSR